MSGEIVRHNGEVIPAGAIMPIISIDQMIARKRLFDECVSKVMREGHDYGVIPGTDKGQAPGKKTLLKPGAEKLCTLFGLTPDFQEDKAVVDFEKGLFFFSYRCALLSGACQEMTPDGRVVTVGRLVGTGIGSANSREKKYRRDSRACPQCGQPAIKRSKYPPREDPSAEPGWYCYGKAGGCGANFAADDPTIIGQAATVNPDEAADLVNTIQKMACKRAMTAAVLIATNASDTFTQDAEDAGRHEPATPRQESRHGSPRENAADLRDKADAILKIAAPEGTAALKAAWGTLSTAMKNAVAEGGGCPAKWKEQASRADAARGAVKQADQIGAEELRDLYALMKAKGVVWGTVQNSIPDLPPTEAALTHRQYAAAVEWLNDLGEDQSTPFDEEPTEVES